MNEQVDRNDQVIRMLEQANEHISIAFHPELGWATPREEYNALVDKYGALGETLAIAMQSPDFPPALATEIREKFGIGVVKKHPLPNTLN